MTTTIFSTDFIADQLVTELTNERIFATPAQLESAVGFDNIQNIAEHILLEVFEQHQPSADFYFSPEDLDEERHDALATAIDETVRAIGIETL
jgi:hypothetical protein